MGLIHGRITVDPSFFKPSVIKDTLQQKVNL